MNLLGVFVRKSCTEKKKTSELEMPSLCIFQWFDCSFTNWCCKKCQVREVNTIPTLFFLLGFLGLRLGDEGLPFFYAKTWYKFLASVNGLGYCKTSFESQKSLNNKFNTLSEPQQQRSDPSSARAFAFLIPLRSALKRVLSLTAGSVFFISVHAAFVL